MEPKLIVLRITVPQTHVPRLLAKFSARLDEMEPLNPPKKWNNEDSIKVYDEPLRDQSLDQFLVAMEQEHKLVIAWYEKKSDPRDSNRIYHNLVYVFAQEDNAKAHKRFAPRRPLLSAELRELFQDNTFTVRGFYDNPYLDKDGQPVENWRRWEINLNLQQSVVVSRPKEQLPFQGARRSVKV